MNNLKRVLSLALSGIMLVGMMAMGASAADFTDADKIQHDDAVNVLVALKVINGQDDGSFNPEGDVTRGQMAKMIAVAMNGGNEANTGVKGTPTFTDIKGHWAESYIEYCADLGVISGRGDGTFDPDGNVTGLEATKMVLTALGYDATAYRLTGASWAVRTDELARAADPNLYDELTGVVMANKASRDVAAQLIWNGMQNTTKRVTPNTNTSTGEVTWTYGDGKGTLLKERYDANIVYGTYYGNANTSDNAEKGEIVVSYKYTEVGEDGKDVARDGYYYVPSNLDISNIGEEVKVIYKNGKDSRTSGPDRKDIIYGVFTTGKTEVVKATRGDVKDNNSTKAQIKVGDTKYDLASTVTVWTNYVGEGTEYTAKHATNTTVGKDDESNSKLTDDLKAKSGSPIKLVMNRDGKVTSIYMVDSVLARVTAKNSEKVTLNNGIGTLTIKDHDIYEDIKKDDVVVATALYKTKAEDGYTTVVKAEPVSGTVKGYKDTTNVKLDDTTYKILGGTKFDALGIDDEVEDFTNKIGEDFNLYLVNGYVAAAAQTSEANSNYSVVIDKSQKDNEAGSVLQGLQIRVMGSDGAITTLTLSSDSKKVTGYDKDGKEETEKITKANQIGLGDIVTYSVNKDNTADVKVESAAKKADAEKKDIYEKKTKSFDGTTTSTNCVLFVDLDNATPTYGDSFKAYAIRDLNNITVDKDAMMTVVEKDNEVVAVFLALAKKPSGATSTTVYGIVSAYNGTEKIDGTNYLSFTVDVNDEQQKVYVKSDADLLNSKSEGALVQLELTADSIYTKDELKVVDAAFLAKNGIAGYVTKFRDDTITLTTKVIEKTDSKGNKTYEADNTKSSVYAVDKDTEFYFVDKDENEGVMSSISEFDAIQGKKNVIVIVDSDGVTATQVIFEVSNKKDIL